MKKNDRISEFVRTLGQTPELALDPHYAGYFTCFNRGEYYEAHDVLEQLWLRTSGPDHLFFKGLIQIAGAFVHLRRQYLRPHHPKDGRRLRPAVRLFLLGAQNLAPFGPEHLYFKTGPLLALCAHHVSEISASHFTHNPWHPTRLPLLKPPAHD